MNRNSSLDFFKGVAIFLVICLHAAPLWPYPIPNFALNTIMRFAVPIFFTISGYLLFNKIKYKDDFGARIKKYSFTILKYYVIATIVLFGADYLLFKEWVGNSLKIYPFHFAFYYGLLTSDTFHLWYLIANFWAGIIIWFFCRKNINNIKKVLIFSGIIHLIGMFIGNQPLNFSSNTFMYQRDGLFYGLFYLSLGCYFGLHPENLGRIFKKGSSIKLILLFSLGQLVERSLLVFTRFDFKTEYQISQNYWGEYFLFTIPLTLAILKYALDNPNKFSKNIFTKAGEQSLIIYIIHAPFNTLFFSLVYKDEKLMKFAPMVFLVSAICSFTLAIIIKKIKTPKDRILIQGENSL